MSLPRSQVPGRTRQPTRCSFVPNFRTHGWVPPLLPTGGSGRVTSERGPLTPVSLTHHLEASCVTYIQEHPITESPQSIASFSSVVTSKRSPVAALGASVAGGLRGEAVATPSGTFVTSPSPG